MGNLGEQLPQGRHFSKAVALQFIGMLPVHIHKAGLIHDAD